MKKFKVWAYIVLILIIAGLLVVLYSTTVKGNSEKNSKEKALSEIEFLEGKIQTMLNKLNNLETRNYNVSVSEITKQDKELKNTSESNEGKEESGSGSNSGSSTGEESGTGSSSGNESGGGDSSTDQSQTNKKYEMEQSGVLVNSDEVEWDKIKAEIETLYTTIPTITLDLYKINTPQEDILSFNKEFDKVATKIKEENKEETLNELAILYEYIPKFLQYATDDEKTKKLADVKAHLYKAYAKLDAKNWEEIDKETQESISKYNELLSNTKIDKEKQYSVSKGYIMLNELKSTVEIEDDTVFLIKYKNALEEINNL